MHCKDSAWCLAPGRSQLPASEPWLPMGLIANISVHSSKMGMAELTSQGYKEDQTAHPK